MIIIFDFLFRGEKVENITVNEVKEKLEKKDCKVIDVRTEAEYQQGHIPVAINIPLAQLDQELDDLDKEKEIIMVCASGMRSRKATKKLIKSGYQRVKNMTGGMRAWTGKIKK